MANLLYFVSKKVSETPMPQEYGIPISVQIILLVVAVVALLVVYMIMSLRCNKLKKQIKKLQSELEEAKKQQAINDYKSSNPESTKKE